MGVFSSNKQAQKSVAKPEPVNPSADMKKELLSSSSASEANIPNKTSSLAPVTPKEVPVARKFGCFSASTRMPSKQTSAEQWSWLPRMLRPSCSVPKRPLASSSRKRSRSVPKNGKAQHKPVLEAKPATRDTIATRAVLDAVYENVATRLDKDKAAASGDTQAMPEIMLDEKFEAMLVASESLPVSSAAKLPVSPAPIVADEPPMIKSCLWQCTDPFGSTMGVRDLELHTA